MGKRFADVLGLGRIKLGGGDEGKPEWREEGGDLAHLPRFGGCDARLPADRPHRPVAFSCAAKISPQPIRARRNSRSRPSSSKVSPSAVSCASTIAPSAVSTKLPSLPAVESSS